MTLRVTRQLGEALGSGEGSLHITRQHGDVLGRGQGKLRVTHQHAEVLANVYVTYVENLGHNLSISDNAHILERHERIESSISFTQKLPAQITKTFVDDLNLKDVVARIQSANLADVITFLENYVYPVNEGEHISLHETLAIIDEFDFELGLFFILISNMVLSDDVVNIGPRYKILWTRIHLHDGMPVEDYFEKLEDILYLTSSAGRNYNVSASTIMSLTDETWRSATPVSIMNLVQSLDWGKTKGIPTQWLDLEQTVDLTGDWARTVIDTLGIGHSLTYYLPDPCDNKAYTPFVGESDVTDSPTPPDNDIPFAQGLPEGERFLLLYPALGESTDIVELRAPNLDNRERQAFTRINRETRGGKLSIFADPTWPKINTLILSFSGLTKAEVEETQQFMVDHIGQEVGIIDWEGRQWVGIITTPNERAVQDGKQRFTITFEFEGLMVEELPSGNAMSIVDSFTHYFYKARSLENTIEWAAWTQRWVEFSRSLTDTLVMSDEVVETVESP